MAEDKKTDIDVRILVHNVKEPDTSDIFEARGTYKDLFAVFTSLLYRSMKQAGISSEDMIDITTQNIKIMAEKDL